MVGKWHIYFVTHILVHKYTESENHLVANSVHQMVAKNHTFP